METQDGREKIDSELDNACDALAVVSQRMHDYWIRGIEERLAYEQERQNASFALANASITRIERGRTAKVVLNGRDQVTKMLKKMQLEDPAGYQRFMAEFMEEDAPRSGPTQSEGEEGL